MLPENISVAAATSAITIQETGALYLAGPMALRRAMTDVNRSTFHGAGHTLTYRDLVQFYRTYPKRNGDSRGTTKCSVKMTMDIDVANAVGSGTIILPIIAEASFSVPVGCAPETALLIRQKLCRLLCQATSDPVDGVSIGHEMLLSQQI